MTPRQFDNYATGHLDGLDQRDEFFWTEIRNGFFMASVGHLKKSAKAEKCWPLPWDNQSQRIDSAPVTPEEVERVKEYSKRVYEKLDGKSDS